MKRIIYIAVIIVIQHLTLNNQNSIAQTPINTPDNLGSGNCLDVDDQTYARIEDHVSLRPSTISLDLWFFASDANDTGSIIAKWRSGFAFSWAMAAGPTLMEFHVNGAMRASFDKNLVSVNQWHNLVGTYDGTTAKLYLDGVLQSSNTYTGGIPYGSNPVLIGQECDSPLCNGALSFNGKVDEVRIWNTVRTQQEIRDNMCLPLVGNEPGLVGYWNMNEGTGTTINDLTSNNNDGTLQ